MRETVFDPFFWYITWGWLKGGGEKRKRKRGVPVILFGSGVEVVRCTFNCHSLSIVADLVSCN